MTTPDPRQASDDAPGAGVARVVDGGSEDRPPVTVSESLNSRRSLTASAGASATCAAGVDDPRSGGAGETSETFPARWPVAVGHWLADWAPVAVEPAEPAAVARYAALAGWCAPYALRWRRAGITYAYLVALPVTTTCYSAAWLAQWVGGIDTGWLPTHPAADGRGRRARWLAAHPPSLAELGATSTVVAGPRRAAAVLSVAVSAVAYGLAWTFQRPGRLAAAVALAAVVWFG